MSVWTQPTPRDADSFVQLVADGVDPYRAARMVDERLTASRFRSLARSHPD